MKTKALLSFFILVPIFIISSLLFISKTDTPSYIEGSLHEETKTSNSHKQQIVKPAVNTVSRSSANAENEKSTDSDLQKLLETKMNLLALFKNLQRLFIKSSDFGSHLNDVYNYLIKNFDKDIAESLFRVYSKYIGCDQTLASKLPSLTEAKSLQDVLNTIDYVENFRKDYLGEKLYDALYADSAEKKKYIVNRSYILNDKNLYSYEKKAKLEDLQKANSKYEEEVTPARPFDKYQESLALYSKELSEMSPEEKEARKETIKKEVYPKETLERLKVLQEKDRIYDSKVTEYYSKKEEIEKDDSLTEKEKNEEMADLQSKTFNHEELDRLKRNEAMEKGRQALLKKYGFQTSN